MIFVNNALLDAYFFTFYLRIMVRLVGESSNNFSTIGLKRKQCLQMVKDTQSLIDENSTKMRDNDYINICNNLQILYKKLHMCEGSKNVDYSNSSYYELEDELHLIQERMNTLHYRTFGLKVKKNLSKEMKYLAIKEYAARKEIDMKKYDEINLKDKQPKMRLKDIKDLYKAYLEKYNDTICKARGVIDKEYDVLRRKRDAVIIEMYEYIYEVE